MSATDLDLPVLLSADQIRRREFVAIRRGYDPAQVRDYLDQLAAQVQQMESMLRDARLEADAAVRAAAQPRVDPYTQLAGRVAGVLRAADEEAERIRREASADAERMIGEARADADRIRTDAQSRAEETRTEAEVTLREAREQVDRTISGLATKREALVDQLATMQERLVGVARDLESTITSSEDPDGEPDATSVFAVAAETVPRAPVAPSGEEPEDRTIVLEDGPSIGNDAIAGDLEDDLDDEARMALLDPAFEALWDGTETVQLEVPDIPPLDLDWGDDDDAVAEDGDR